MCTSEQCTHITYYDPKLEDYLGNESITCVLGCPLKRLDTGGRKEEGKLQGRQVSKVEIQLHMGDKSRVKTPPVPTE